jgi:putative ABC transport system permease protein
LSLRAALGASRIRLAAIVLTESLLTESLLLALGGGVVGLGLAHLALRQVVRLLPVTGPDLMRIELNGTVAGVALLISVAASVLAGLIPAVRASRSSVAESLKEGGAHASQGRAGSHLRRGLVVAEVALSLALLVSAGLSVRAFQRQIGTDPGFDPSNLLSFTVQLPTARYGEPALVEEFYDDAVTALQRGPGVLAATSTSRLPLGAGGYGLFRSFILEGAAPPPEGSDFGASWVEVDADYFRTMGIVPLDGRGFTPNDRSDAPPVAIVSRSLSRQMSPDGSIVGRQMRTLYDEILPRTVVGVIDDIQFRSPTSGRDEALVLVPRSQAARASMGFLVRTVGDPSSVMSEVRRVMAGLDSDVALDAMQSLRDAHGAELVGVRFLTVLFSTFGALALLLAVSGVYGLVSYSVAHRSQEIGIRMAMGASACAVRMSVLREGAMLAAIGLAIGVLIAYGFSRLLAAAVFGLMEIDPVTFLGVALVLATSVLAASWIPAVRATRIDPAKALQSD